MTGAVSSESDLFCQMAGRTECAGEVKRRRPLNPGGPDQFLCDQHEQIRQELSREQPAAVPMRRF